MFTHFYFVAIEINWIILLKNKLNVYFLFQANEGYGCIKFLLNLKNILKFIFYRILHQLDCKKIGYYRLR